VFSILLLSFSLLLCRPALADGPEVYFLVKGAHMSALTRGCPFRCDTTERTQEFLGAGATVVIGNFEMDFAHGLKSLDCDGIRNCKWEEGTELTARWYPFKGRNRR